VITCVRHALHVLLLQLKQYTSYQRPQLFVLHTDLYSITLLFLLSKNSQNKAHNRHRLCS